MSTVAAVRFDTDRPARIQIPTNEQWDAEFLGMVAEQAAPEALAEEACSFFEANKGLFGALIWGHKNLLAFYDQEDLWQEVQFAVARSFWSYNPDYFIETKPTTYFWHVAENRLNELYRAQKAQKRGGKQKKAVSLDTGKTSRGRKKADALDGAADLTEGLLASPDADPGSDASLDLSLLRDCLGKVEGKWRHEVLSLYLEGWTQVETADILGVSQAAVSMWLADAKAQVFKAFKEARKEVSE